MERVEPVHYLLAFVMVYKQVLEVAFSSIGDLQPMGVPNLLCLEGVLQILSADDSFGSIPLPFGVVLSRRLSLARKTNLLKNYLLSLPHFHRNPSLLHGGKRVFLSAINSCFSYLDQIHYSFKIRQTLVKEGILFITETQPQTICNHRV